MITKNLENIILESSIVLIGMFVLQLAIFHSYFYTYEQAAIILGVSLIVQILSGIAALTSIAMLILTKVRGMYHVS